ncbi:MAG: hypothetical protein Q8916_08425 [Bacteroidota bacterium]|nr:hypothetical protein [Bacteroidota bacterium]
MLFAHSASHYVILKATNNQPFTTLNHILLPIFQEIITRSNLVPPLEANEDIEHGNIVANIDRILARNPSMEEAGMRNYLETLTLAQLQDVQALYMLGISNDPTEQWILIRTEGVDPDRELCIDFLVGIRRNLSALLPEGLDRLFAQIRQ